MWLEEAKVDIADNELPNQPSTYVLVRRTTIDRLIGIAEGAIKLRQLFLGNDVVDAFTTDDTGILYDFCRRVDGVGPYNK